MHKITAKKSEAAFVPFTLHCRITTKKTADNIVKLLEHIIKSEVGGGRRCMSPAVNKEQHRWAQDVCNMIERSK